MTPKDVSQDSVEYKNLTMRKKTKKILAKKIRDYMYHNNIVHLQEKNPFPVSWRTISSIKKESDQCFNKATQRKLLDFFGLAYRLDGRDFEVIEILQHEDSN